MGEAEEERMASWVRSLVGGWGGGGQQGVTSNCVWGGACHLLLLLFHT